jgi:hypothetical protein
MPELKGRTAPNGGCVRCGRCDGLHTHHVQAQADGGSDEPENLVELCSPCHGEWHAVEAVGLIPFEKWVETPPAMWLLAMDETAGFNELPAEERAQVREMLLTFLRTVWWETGDFGKMVAAGHLDAWFANNAVLCRL